MSVSIEEVVAESGEEAAPVPAAPAPTMTGGRQEPDLDRLEYQLARRDHRLARLWAD